MLKAKKNETRYRSQNIVFSKSPECKPNDYIKHGLNNEKLFFIYFLFYKK